MTIHSGFDIDDPLKFETNNVLYHYPINNDKLIIGKYSIWCKVFNQWYEAQGKPWTLFRSKLRGMNPKLLVRRSEREDGFNGENNKAEELLKMALDVSPGNATANFNMGLLKAEQKKMVEAEQYLQRAIKSNPRMHEAIFTLGVLLAGKRPDESVDLLFAAFEINPNLRYAYTLAFYLHQNREFDRAEPTLRFMIESWPQYADSYLLLVDIYELQHKKTEAIQFLNNALSTKGMKERDRFRLAAKLRDLQNNQ